MNGEVCTTPTEGKNAVVWAPTHKYVNDEDEGVSY